MAHCISGLVADPGLLEDFAIGHALAPPASLDHGLAFLPLELDEMQRISGQRWEFELIDDEYADIQSGFVETVRALSAIGPVVYLHTEYFGGEGGQAAIAAHDGQIVFGPEHGNMGPIASALVWLGIPRENGIDGFDRVGLNRHRSNDDWRDVAAG